MGRLAPSRKRSSHLHLVVTSLLGLGLSCIACGSTAETPLLSVEFGTDFNGSSVTGSLSKGIYSLHVACTGANQVAFRLQSGSSIAHSTEIPCNKDTIYEFTLSEPVRSEVSMVIEGVGASGQGKLYRG